MPTISIFYGILVSMYVFDSDRHHLPHIHDRYNEFKASIAIPNGDVLEGSLPVRQMKLIQAWIELHQDDLMADWYLATNGQTFKYRFYTEQITQFFYFNTVSA